MPHALPSLVIPCLLSLAASQAGSWEALSPGGAPAPPASRWHSAASILPSFYTLGGYGPAANATFRYDADANVWTVLPTLPDAFVAPAVVAFGGMLLSVGGLASDGSHSDALLLMCVGKLDASPRLPWSTTNYNSGWASAAIPGSFGARRGHKVVVFGGKLLLFGGMNGATYSNELWGLDVSSFLLNTTMSNGAVAGWVPLSQQGSTAAPSPRSAFSWDAVSDTTLVFGGNWASDNSSTPAARLLSNDAFYYTPGTSVLEPGAGRWRRVDVAGASPPCRYGHASGVLVGLWVFGGSTWNACGTAPGGGPVQLSDLWYLDLSLRVWTQVASSGAWPGPRGVPVGSVMGRHFYVYGGGTTQATGSDLWRWSPSLAAPAPDATPSTAHLVAGLTLSALANAAVAVWVGVAYWRSRGGGVGATPGASAAIGGAYETL